MPEKNAFNTLLTEALAKEILFCTMALVPYASPPCLPASRGWADMQGGIHSDRWIILHTWRIKKTHCQNDDNALIKKMEDFVVFLILLNGSMLKRRLKWFTSISFYLIIYFPSPSTESGNRITQR